MISLNVKPRTLTKVEVRNTDTDVNLPDGVSGNHVGAFSTITYTIRGQKYLSSFGGFFILKNPYWYNVAFQNRLENKYYASLREFECSTDDLIIQPKESDYSATLET